MGNDTQHPPTADDDWVGRREMEYWMSNDDAMTVVWMVYSYNFQFPKED